MSLNENDIFFSLLCHSESAGSSPKALHRAALAPRYGLKVLDSRIQQDITEKLRKDRS